MDKKQQINKNKPKDEDSDEISISSSDSLSEMPRDLRPILDDLEIQETHPAEDTKINNSSKQQTEENSSSQPANNHSNTQQTSRGAISKTSTSNTKSNRTQTSERRTAQSRSPDDVAGPSGINHHRTVHMETSDEIPYTDSEDLRSIRDGDRSV